MATQIDAIFKKLEALTPPITSTDDPSPSPPPRITPPPLAAVPPRSHRMKLDVPRFNGD
ncbi:hypothetical protein A2U01_0088052, partial [Trifolium medium]|nr:hypothetical protein [Trifolium medium]